MLGRGRRPGCRQRRPATGRTCSPADSWPSWRSRRTHRGRPGPGSSPSFRRSRGRCEAPAREDHQGQDEPEARPSPSGAAVRRSVNPDRLAGPRRDPRVIGMISRSDPVAGYGRSGRSRCHRRDSDNTESALGDAGAAGSDYPTSGLGRVRAASRDSARNMPLLYWVHVAAQGHSAGHSGCRLRIVVVREQTGPRRTHAQPDSGTLGAAEQRRRSPWPSSFSS